MILELPKDVKKIPKKSGIYIFYDENEEVIYVGKTQELYKRTIQHLPSDSRFPWGKYIPWSFIDRNIKKVKFMNFILVPLDSLDIIERCLIEFFKPKYNLM